VKLSSKALALIIEFEVGGGKSYYEKALARPTWPGGASGVTIGIGYDLGYTPRERFLGDWASLEDPIRERLAAVIGIKGYTASGKVSGLRDIRIPWDVALSVFDARTVPYWIEQTLKAFPGANKLPADAFGALVSLVFNRGPATAGKNREEMAAIMHLLADGVQAGDLAKIAAQLRTMKRIWQGKGLPGLIRRREAEAQLVESAG
jgi:hypothetical protein